MSSEMEKDLHFLKHFFAEQFFNSEVYSLRQLFNHSTKAVSTKPPPVYTLRRLFKESTGRRKQKVTHDGFFLQKLFFEREKQQVDIFEMERLFLDKLFCEKRTYSTDDIFNLKSFFRSVYTSDDQSNGYYIVHDLHDLFYEEETTGK